MSEASIRYDVFRSGIGQPVRVRVTDLLTGRSAEATERSEVMAREYAVAALRGVPLRHVD